MARPVGETEDLALLGDLTEEVLLGEIEARYAKDQIYVREPLPCSASLRLPFSLDCISYIPRP